MSIDHIIGCKDEELRALPDLTNLSIVKDARRRFTEREKLALIEEDGEASNTHRIDVKGTHYESQTPAEIAMSILPLKGL
jgi:hypothetical protein